LRWANPGYVFSRFYGIEKIVWDRYSIEEIRETENMFTNGVAEDSGVTIQIDRVSNAPATETPYGFNAPLSISGWAINEKQDNLPDAIALEIGGKIYPCERYARPDIVREFENEAYANAGFSATVNPEILKLPSGTYGLSILSYYQDNNSTQFSPTTVVIRVE
jgi:hypothetical protein